jgi:hypothetical protein
MGLPHPKKSRGWVYLIPKKVGDGFTSSQKRCWMGLPHPKKSRGWVYLISKKVLDGLASSQKSRGWVYPFQKKGEKNKEQKVLKQHEENINYRWCGIFRLTFM